MKTPNLKWDQRYMDLAKQVSEWSKDTNSKVGAVLLDEETWPIALGYNGFPAGVEDSAERLQDKELKLNMVVHAEQNALLCAGARARNGIIYVCGKPVCPRCAVLIIQAGIRKVVGIRPEPDRDDDSKWHREGLISLAMFAEAKVDFCPLPEA